MISDDLVPVGNRTNKALSMFRSASVHARLRGLWSRLARSCFCLRQLDETLESGCVEASRYSGIKTVSIDRIHGTEGKVGEFDAEFNPIQERSRSRWISIAREKLRGRELPPVELIEIGDTYFVRDGHHRISVCRAMGQSFIDAEVTSLRLCQPGVLR